jgi:hypothetical protein
MPKPRTPSIVLSSMKCSRVTFFGRRRVAVVNGRGAANHRGWFGYDSLSSRKPRFTSSTSPKPCGSYKTAQSGNSRPKSSIGLASSRGALIRRLHNGSGSPSYECRHAIPHLSDKPTTYKSWETPAGTPVSMTIADIHHDEAIYPNSHSFIPEHWLNSPKTENGSSLDRNFVGFGKGARSCLGINYYFHLSLQTGRRNSTQRG